MPEPVVGSPQRGALLLLAILLMVVEYCWQRRRGVQAYDWRETAASTLVFIGQFGSKLLTTLLLAPLLLWIHGHRLFDLRVDGALRLTALFIAVEFTYYWFHRASHRIRWLWATHCVHHSSTRLNLSAAVRLGWTNLLSGGWLLFLPLIWIGYPPSAVFGLLAVGLLYQFVLHTEAIGRLGWLEWVLNTPSHHRVHHSADADLLDRNFGGVLIVFDRLLGTFAEEPADRPLHYGLAGDHQDPSGLDPIAIALAGWKQLFAGLSRVRRPADIVRLLFGTP